MTPEDADGLAFRRGYVLGLCHARQICMVLAGTVGSKLAVAKWDNDNVVALLTGLHREIAALEETAETAEVAS